MGYGPWSRSTRLCSSSSRSALSNPEPGANWRTFGGFSAFIVALFVEMYGFPPTIYLASGWIAKDFPALIRLVMTRAISGVRCWASRVIPTLNPIHIASNLFILVGFLLLSASWRVLYNAQHEGQLATTGPIPGRRPQYVGFIVNMSGFPLQWPTLITLLMFPILVTFTSASHGVKKPKCKPRSGTHGMNTPRERPSLFDGFIGPTQMVWDRSAECARKINIIALKTKTKGGHALRSSYS